ncbi:hypothetical protein [Chryseobacterium sp.]|uniref:hypothetical protein n=1 Tax=Chryseobacterium sp. TaxID=1871047 RepID=UPI0028A00241|nr:hypothetical protein [Chryseobacterium sp.]
MKDSTIKNIGNYTFIMCFILGNICLIGSFITGDMLFAIGGYLLLIYGSIVNLLVIVCLLLYGFINPTKLNACFRASAVLCVNIPIAALYAYIGISFNSSV